eukprot:4795074-Amphidinium_carterae.1
MDLVGNAQLCQASSSPSLKWRCWPLFELWKSASPRGLLATAKGPGGCLPVGPPGVTSDSPMEGRVPPADLAGNR